MLTNLVPNSPELFYCKSCQYSSSRKSQYDRHCSTSKHKNLTSVNNFSSENSNIYNCTKCNKIYKSRVGLWSHKKKCVTINTSEKHKEQTHDITPELILNIIKQNQELQQIIFEQNKSIIEMSKNNITNN